MWVQQAYRFALDPAPAQAGALFSHGGAARFAFNWALGLVKAALSQREAEKTYGVATELLTEVPWSLYALRRRWNVAKDGVAPWWGENSKEAYNSGLEALARALRNWADSRTGKRKGKKVGFPRFKSKHRTTPACRFSTGTIRVEADRRHVTLPRLGTIRTCESTRKLARHLERGTGRILSATIRWEGGRWFVSFTCEIDRAEHVPARPGAVVGVDLGVKALAVLSTGQVVDNPRHHRSALRRLRRLNRQLARQAGPRTSAGGRREPSARWRKTKAALGKAHARAARQRRDGLHKLTSELARLYGTVVVENLNVSGMLANRRLARAVADVGMGEVRRQLTYKTGWGGGQLVVASRWYPSSKTCSGCGVVKAKLALSERIFECGGCGLVLDRDLNAARNLATLAADVAQSCGETVNARRGAVGPGTCAGRAPVKREPRKRGTPLRQRGGSLILNDKH
ncbi:IS607 family element RNA-guided endonuclease TnpB [Streptosporangium sp. NBC_01755]|uniref:IS607 family element RNA-guided endonuclease TnpB n=1 Tax=unclassified Streptosporangium TaxID=2632669 RepID=UPI002DDAB392|nr:MULTISPECIES: IS607 family element RNA-guided endonuclease TnpB [unclassified Streptosporangium]WSA29327.1 IS607 family element RNA-guided endonuclease TnpB [Streptosporangium sp. NBC_01810]WSC99231.1 IS607 family element RNA-guided endonuclease TnpB [Streptosporangium sp. NBC_01755]